MQIHTPAVSTTESCVRRGASLPDRLVLALGLALLGTPWLGTTVHAQTNGAGASAASSRSTPTQTNPQPANAPAKGKPRGATSPVPAAQPSSPAAATAPFETGRSQPAPSNPPPSAGKTAAKSAPRPAAQTAKSTGAAGRPVADPDRDNPDVDSREEAEGEDDAPATPEPAVGSAEWLVRETARLRIEPIPEGTPESRVAGLMTARHLKIIDLAQKAIALVHQDPQRQLVFGAAARHLLEARLELAVAGDEEQSALLIDEARAFHQRDPQSDAAAAGALCVTRYAHAQAVNAPDDPDWRVEFTRTARQLLERYPRQRAQAVLLTHTAGCLAEEHGQWPEALACFDAVSNIAPETPQGQESAALARRIRLPGNPPQIAGSTLTGAEFDLDDLLGQPVLVVFWASGSEEFRETWSTARPVVEGAQRQGLQVVGVCLDTDQEVATKAARQLGLTGPQLFSSDPEQAGWNHPVARHYAVFDLPTLWLVDQNGNVVTTRLGLRDLKRQLAAQVAGVDRAGGEATEESAPTSVRPAAGSRKSAPAANGTREASPSSAPPASPARPSSAPGKTRGK